MRTIALLLAALGAVPLVQACEVCEAARQEPQQVAPQALTVVRDAETGALRAPVASEAAALQTKPRTAVVKTAAKQPLLRSYASGAHSAKLPSELASYSVAVRRADGSLDSDCVQGEDAAAKAIQPAVPLPRPPVINKDAE